MSDDPNSDDRFDAQATLARNPDGSWRYAADDENRQVRMNVATSAGYRQDQVVMNHATLATRGYMQSPRDWKNIEITGYVRLVDAIAADDEITWYLRGGRHNGDRPCEGVAYKGDLKFDGRVRFAKEPWHVEYYFRPDNGGNRVTQLILGRWVGFKMVAFNAGANRVRLELWLDDAANNTWTMVHATDDTGGWGSSHDECGTPETQVITWGGPLAVFRWDNVRKIDFKYLSVREIDANATDRLFYDGFEP